jgi:hypothetical protein
MNYPQLFTTAFVATITYFAYGLVAFDDCLFLTREYAKYPFSKCGSASDWNLIESVSPVTLSQK